MSDTSCYNCRQPLGLEPGNISRRETCENCGEDARVCLNCRFYTPCAYNECNEPQAERVVDKEKNNFCDYFSLLSGARDKTKEKSISALDDLFK